MGSKKIDKKKFMVVGVGEILWDMLPGGKKLGGATTNFSYHASVLGADAYIVSSVGKDELGNEIIDRVNELRLSNKYIQLDENYPTGTVEVTLDNKGIPSYIIHENVAWDYIKRTESCVELAKKADAICFGSLGQRSESSRNTILSMLENANDSSNDKCLKIFDINLRQHFYNKEIIHTSLKYANVLKLNDEELPIVAKLLGLEDKSESNNKEKAVNMIESHNTADEHENNKIYILNALADIYSLDLIALTCGKKGSLLLSKGRTSSHPGFKVKIVDTVGAGDAFTAAVTIGLLQGFDLDEINNLANKLASYVCSQEGGTPSLPKELTGLFE